MEGLESRRLLSGGITLLQDGTLLIRGTAEDDWIQAWPDQATSRLNVQVNGDTYALPMTARHPIERILVRGGRGDDDIYMDGSDQIGPIGVDRSTNRAVELPCTIFGGTGNDTISGGHAGDALFGGRGEDALAGSLGADSLFGGQGRDRLTAGEAENIFGRFVAPLQLGQERPAEFVSGGSGSDDGYMLDPATTRISGIEFYEGARVRVTGVVDDGPFGYYDGGTGFNLDLEDGYSLEIDVGDFSTKAHALDGKPAVVEGFIRRWTGIETGVHTTLMVARIAAKN
jgi:hypothetical protein